MTNISSASPKVIRALRARGCDPVFTSAGRWVALCPCCGDLDLTIGNDGPVTGAERDEWLDARGG